MSLNISGFNLFFMWQLQPLWKKVTPSFPANPPLKSWGPIRLTLFENLVEGSPPPPPPAEKGEGAHYAERAHQETFSKFSFSEKLLWKVVNKWCNESKQNEVFLQTNSKPSDCKKCYCLFTSCFFYCVTHKNAHSVTNLVRFFETSPE